MEEKSLVLLDNVISFYLDDVILCTQIIEYEDKYAFDIFFKSGIRMQFYTIENDLNKTMLKQLNMIIFKRLKRILYNHKDINSLDIKLNNIYIDLYDSNNNIIKIK